MHEKLRVIKTYIGVKTLAHLHVFDEPYLQHNFTFDSCSTCCKELEMQQLAYNSAAKPPFHLHKRRHLFFC